MLRITNSASTPDSVISASSCSTGITCEIYTARPYHYYRPWNERGAEYEPITRQARALRLLPTRIVFPGWASPSHELAPPPPGVSQRRTHRPCHLRAIPSTTPPVCHGQPRTLTVLWP